MNEIRTTAVPSSVALTESTLKNQDRQQATVVADKSQPAQQRDLVTVTSQAERLLELEKKLVDMPAVDSQRVKTLRDAIASGTFRIDPEQIAFKLLRSEAESFKLVG